MSEFARPIPEFEQVRPKLIEFLGGCELGSTKFRGVSDWTALHHTESALAIHVLQGRSATEISTARLIKDEAEIKETMRRVETGPERDEYKAAYTTFIREVFPEYVDRASTVTNPLAGPAGLHLNATEAILGHLSTYSPPQRRN